MSALRRFGAAGLLFVRTIRASLVRGISLREVLHQTDDIASRSVWLVSSAMALFGAVIVIIAHRQSMRFIGDMALSGPPYFELMVREFGPLAASILVAARFGASNSAELASMTVNEQVQALVLSAGDPLAELVAPRVIGGIIGFTLLAILGTAVAALVAAGMAQFVYHSNGAAFIDARFVRYSDVVCGLGKAAVAGAYVPLVTSREGFAASGGATGVGERTTSGVVGAVLGCLVIDFVFAVGFRLVHL